MKFRIGKWSILDARLKHYIPVTGIRSTCEDLKHVLFLDFDDTPLCQVETCCRILQEKFECGTFYILKTCEEGQSPSYHAICLDKFSLMECVYLQDFVGCDRSFISLSYRRGFWVLRFSKKGKKTPPEYVHTLVAEGKRKVSWAHAKWLYTYIGIPIGKLENIDNLSKLWIHRYVTFEKHRKG